MSIAYSQIMIVDSESNRPSSAQVGQFVYCQDTQATYIWGGSSWITSARVQVKKTTSAINAKNTGTTLLYTLEASSLNFYPVMVIPRATGAGISGVVTGPTMSIGTNSTSYNNVATTGLLGSILTALGAGNSQPTNTSYSPGLAGGTQIFANVTLGAVATNFTTLYDIIGFYDS